MAKLKKARSQNAGVEADWHPQPSPRVCFRRSVQRESIFSIPGNLLQVRYEMLRRHIVEEVSIVDVAAKFWLFSRPHRLPGPRLHSSKTA